MNTVIWAIIFLWFIIIIVSGVYKRLWPAFLGASISLIVAGAIVYNEIDWWFWFLWAGIVFALLWLVFLFLDIRQAKKEDREKEIYIITPDKRDKR